MKKIQLIAVTLFTLFVGFHAMTGAALAQGAEEIFARAVTAVHDGDDEKAFSILRPLANDGDPRGMSLLGLLIASEDDDEKAQKLGEEWLLKAAEAGDIDAMMLVSSEILGGEETDIIPEKMKEFIQKAAEKGQPMAQLYLGLSLYEGSVFEEDKIKAKYWISKAMEGRELLANEVFFMLWKMKKNWRNLLKGNRWRELLDLANEGYAYPAFLRGKYWFYGVNGPVNYLQAAKWFTIAIYINQGFEEAERYMQKIESKIDKKPNVADDWFREHAKDGETRYAIAAMWCVLEKASEIGCLRNAIYHHKRCNITLYNGYFDNYVSSRGYQKCRKELLTTQSFKLM